MNNKGKWNDQSVNSNIQKYFSNLMVKLFLITIVYKKTYDFMLCIELHNSNDIFYITKKWISLFFYKIIIIEFGRRTKINQFNKTMTHSNTFLKDLRLTETLITSEVWKFNFSSNYISCTWKKFYCTTNIYKVWNKIL